MPLQIGLILLLLYGIYLLSKRYMGFRGSVTFDCPGPALFRGKTFFKLIAFFLVISFFISVPFVFKSVYYAKTPLFPFMPGILSSKEVDRIAPSMESVVESSKKHIAGARTYGDNISFLNFLKHFWLLAVPEKSVNNRFDYPIGLPYLLFLGPFLYYIAGSIRKREFAFTPFLVVIYWIAWWFTAQQARFLFIPLVLMFIVVASTFKRQHYMLMFALSIALTLNLLSVFRANYKDLLKPRYAVLRQYDKQLFDMNRKYYLNNRQDTVVLDNIFVGYAQFPVKLVKENSAWVFHDKKIENE